MTKKKFKKRGFVIFQIFVILFYLVPELCNATGLTDAMRCDFKVMQELAKTTRVKPDVRNEELQGFLDQIQALPYA